MHNKQQQHKAKSIDDEPFQQPTRDEWLNDHVFRLCSLLFIESIFFIDRIIVSTMGKTLQERKDKRMMRLEAKRAHLCKDEQTKEIVLEKACVHSEEPMIQLPAELEMYQHEQMRLRQLYEAHVAGEAKNKRRNSHKKQRNKSAKEHLCVNKINALFIVMNVV